LLFFLDLKRKRALIWKIMTIIIYVTNR
jgi:hypothetical protein